jgi:hypothetical protein
MKDIYFWSGVLVGSFLFLPHIVLFVLSFVLMCVFQRYYFPLLLLFLVDLTSEGVHPLVFSLLYPINHIYFPYTVGGVLLFLSILLARRFVWVSNV